MIREGLFDRFPMDAVYGLHNWPRLPRGTIAMRTGPIMAAADRFDIKIKGVGGHAAIPHKVIDPIIVGAQIVGALQTLVSRSANPIDPMVISITNFNAGTGAFNVIPETAHLSGTLRSFDQNTRQSMIRRIGEIAADTARVFGASAVCDFMAGGYDPTVNSADETAFCADIARGIVGDDCVDTATEPVMGAEDFGAMLQAKPGCYIFMGQAEPDDETSAHNHMVHTPHYDFNDAIIPLGIEYWARVVEGCLKK